MPWKSYLHFFLEIKCCSRNQEVIEFLATDGLWEPLEKTIRLIMSRLYHLPGFLSADVESDGRKQPAALQFFLCASSFSLALSLSLKSSGASHKMLPIVRVQSPLGAFSGIERWQSFSFINNGSVGVHCAFPFFLFFFGQVVQPSRTSDLSIQQLV